MKEIQAAGATLLAIDPHDSWSARFLLEKAGVPENKVLFPVLQDAALTVSATYGVASQMRIHTELSNRPATFVIDREGILRFALRGERFNDRPDAAKILQVLNGLRP